MIYLTQRKNNEEIRKYLENEDLNNKKTQAEYIRSQQIIAEEKRKAIELEKKNKIREELERKIIEEQNKIESINNRRELMEKEENELMIKLKTTTQQHEKLVEDYEKMVNQFQSRKNQ